MDQRGADGGVAARVEQEDDDVAGVAHLRHPLQLAAHVRARQVRQVAQAGAAPQGLPGRADGAARAAGAAAARPQQQPDHHQGAAHGAHRPHGTRPGPRRARHARVGPHHGAQLQPLLGRQLLPGLQLLPHARQHGAPAAAVGQEPPEPGRRWPAAARARLCEFPREGGP